MVFQRSLLANRSNAHTKIDGKKVCKKIRISLSEKYRYSKSACVLRNRRIFCCTCDDCSFKSKHPLWNIFFGIKLESTQDNAFFWQQCIFFREKITWHYLTVLKPHFQTLKKTGWFCSSQHVFVIEKRGVSYSNTWFFCHTSQCSPLLLLKTLLPPFF